MEINKRKCSNYPLYGYDILYSFSDEHVSTFSARGKKCLYVASEGLTKLAEQAMIDVAHLLRPGHLQVRN